MIDKSLIYECIQHNNYRFTAGRGVDALYAVIEGMDAQLESAEQMITDYIMKHKNMLRSDRHSYNAFVSSFTSTIQNYALKLLISVSIILSIIILSPA